MSLSCLKCQVMASQDSESDMSSLNGQDHPPLHRHPRHNRLCGLNVERSWSGNLKASPPPYYEKMRGRGAAMVAAKKVKQADGGSHRRLHSTDAVAVIAFAEGTSSKLVVDNGEPKLVRSGGMRRDWSFENLKQRRREEKRKQQGRNF